MLFAILFIFFISVGASYATDTLNSNTNNNQNSLNNDINPTTQEVVQNSDVNAVSQSESDATRSIGANSNSSSSSNSDVISSSNGGSGVKAAGEPTKLSQSQILAASKTLNSYIVKNKKLPTYVTIAGYKFSMQEYMYLLSKTIDAKYKKKTSQITIKYNIRNPTKASGVTIKGKFSKAQYYSYAKSFINYVNKYNTIPNHISTKLGNMQYQTALFVFNKIIYYSATNKGALPSTVSVSIAKTHTLNKNLPTYERSQAKTSTTINPSVKTISQNLIWSASASVKSYVDKNKKLPNYITISGVQYSMPEFLYLLSKAVNTRVSGSTGAIAVKFNVKNPTKPSGATINKKFTKAQYNDMTKRIISYINSNNQAPNFLSAKYGVGNIQYQTVLYGLSCVGSHINSKKAVPSSLTIKVGSSHSMNKFLPVYSGSTGNTAGNTGGNTGGNTNANINTNTPTDQVNGLTTTLLGSDDKGKVELIGTFGNPNSNTKIAYVIGQHPLESQVHNVLYDLMKNNKNSLKYSYYIYKITVTKNPNDYSEGRMNGQLLAQSYVLPHILKNNYNLVIDVHSNQGLVGGNYEKTQFIFAPLNHITSKQIADNLISQIPGLSYYYPASQTSPPFLTEPLVKAGTPTIIFETYRDESIDVTNSLVNQLITKVDNYNFASISTDNTGTISLNSIIDAASRVKTHVESNGVLPNLVTIGTSQYSMPNFLYLLSSAIKNIASGSASGIKPITVNAAANPSGAKITGTLTKDSYIDLATRVSNYIATNKQAPNYASSTLGNIQYQSLVYELSKVLNYVNINGVLPNTLTINTNNPSTLNGGNSGGSSSGGSGSTDSSLSSYLVATKNCQVNDAKIQSLAKQLTSGLTTELAKATAIFNYVKNNIGYSFYYNTAKGAVGTLNAKSGNCVDQTHLLISLLRASGIASRYVNGEATFSSGSRYGHVWAEVYIDGKWVIADTTSSANSLGTIKNWNQNTATIYGRYAEITF